MSNRPCNYCNLQRYKREAKKEGHKIIIRPYQGGFELYKIPRSMDETKFKWNELDHLRLGCWMMSISERCMC